MGGFDLQCARQKSLGRDAWLSEPNVPLSIRKTVNDMVFKCEAATSHGSKNSGRDPKTSAAMTTAVLSVDAGFNVGQNTEGWLAAESARERDHSKHWVPPLCVLGFEANPQLAAQVQGFMNGTFDPKSPGADARVSRQHHLEQNGNRVMLLPVGLAKENTMATLWFGKKDGAGSHEMRADEGTLRADLDVYKKHSKG